MSDLRARLQASLRDRYAIESELGRGGMATVYLVRDLKYDRELALKVLRPELALLFGSDRFLSEIQLTAKLDHPHILTLIDSGEADGLLYYVLPFVRGESLRHRLTKVKQLSLEEAVRITVQVAGALDYAHRKGIVHRDIKPENILLHEGEAMVSDFGIALVLTREEEGRLTGSGVVVGTTAYMSPEQSLGHSPIDGRSDIYSLGCVLFEMLAGDPPFTGPTPQAIRARQLAERPRSLAVVRPTVPAALEQAIQRALASVPADRYTTAMEFAEAVVAAVRGPGTSGGQATLPPAPPRRPAWQAALLVAAAAILVLLIAYWVTNRYPEPDPYRVVVFPPVMAGPPSDAGEGWGVALLIGSTLEHTEPLRWLDGLTLLGLADEREVRRLGPRAARAARRAGARYYLDGAVVRSGDSTTVILRLHDAVGDSLVRQESVHEVTDRTTAPRLALRAIAALLPRILPPNGRVDLSYLATRNPAAIAEWLLGEQAYARSQFHTAMGHLDRALAMDSAMGVAALRAAEAAAHLEDFPAAESRVELALRLDHQLPRHHRALARGLRFYLTGVGDSALVAFRLSQAGDTSWSEPWMWIGETYYHLLLSGAGLDSVAEESFSRAVRLNARFAPALFHLAEMAARRGDHRRARARFEAFREVSPDPEWTLQLELTLRCAEKGPGGIDWKAAVAEASDRVVNVARFLGAGARHPECSREALRAVLAHDTVSTREHVTYRWSALKGLDYQLIAEGRVEEARALLDSALRHGMPAAAALDVPNALVAGPALRARPDSSMAPLIKPISEMGIVRLWYFALWHHLRGDLPRLDSVAARSRAVADSSGNPADRMVADGARARLLLVRGDTAGAVAQLLRLRQGSSVGLVAWGLWESGAAERLLLAQLLLARGELEKALEVATLFDSPRSQVHLLYLQASLEVRREAAERLGRRAERDRYSARLLALRAGERRAAR